jgi:hypothetical protein
LKGLGVPFFLRFGPDMPFPMVNGVPATVIPGCTSYMRLPLERS